MKRTGLILMGWAIYPGLAIVGWGGFAAFFSHAALVVVTMVLLAASLVAMAAPGGFSKGVREERGNRWVLGAFTFISLLLAFLPAWSDHYDTATLDGDVLRWAGVPLFAAGTALRLWSVFVLGDRFSGLVAIQPGHALVTAGPYSHIRHPSYLGLMLSTLGWSLCFRSAIGLLLTGLLLIPLVARISAEERLLLSHFGALYEAYRARTWRLIPRLY